MRITYKRVNTWETERLSYYGANEADSQTENISALLGNPDLQLSVIIIIIWYCV